MAELRVQRRGQLRGKRVDPQRDRFQSLDVLLGRAPALRIADDVAAFAQGGSELRSSVVHPASSASNCRRASTQSSCSVPGIPICTRRSAMKYARNRISSSLG